MNTHVIEIQIWLFTTLSKNRPSLSAFYKIFLNSFNTIFIVFKILWNEQQYYNTITSIESKVPICLHYFCHCLVIWISKLYHSLGKVSQTINYMHYWLPQQPQHHGWRTSSWQHTQTLHSGNGALFFGRWWRNSNYKISLLPLTLTCCTIITFCMTQFILQVPETGLMFVDRGTMLNKKFLVK